MKQAPWLLAPNRLTDEGVSLRLDDGESRHAFGALRLTSGTRVVLVDGEGSLARGALTLARRGSAEVLVESVESVPRPAGGLTLAVGILAGSAMDPVVQKAVELGVERLVPVCCRRSQLGAKRAASRLDHWDRLSRQALKQCHRVWAMTVSAPVSLAELVSRVDSGRGVLAHPSGLPVRELSLHPDTVLLVGPEGGLAPEEEALLDAEGWRRLRLGPHILRASTAAIAGAAVALHESG
ncbi:MAG: RsmE family RNA methyltransferase [Thermoanaerobaculales bacterium]|jgi:16S rRNA (uracil1498-N3)-methyltransferase|nr:RsmE family RNA methyltransferase [Thermoanaerobaculales bacterium]